MKHKQLMILSSLIVLLASSPMALATNTWYVNGVSGNDSSGCMVPLGPMNAE